MEEKNEVESEAIKGNNQPEIEQNKIENSFNNIENNEKNNLENSSSQIKLNPEGDTFKNNNIINNESIINNNLNNNNFIQFTPLNQNIKQFNYNNLSREEKIEKIENNLHSLLSELSTLKQKGNELFNNKNYEAAEQQYKEGIKKIEESQILSDIDEVNGQIQEYILNINKLNISFYNNLSTALFKQGKYKESLKNSEFIIQNLCQEHVVSYCRILYCLIELKKVIEANYYAEIIKKKFGNQNCYSNFHEQLVKLEILNREFSDTILSQNPQLKQEVISMNNNLKINNEGEKNIDNGYKKYIPYLVGGALILFAGGRILYKKYKDK